MAILTVTRVTQILMTVRKKSRNACERWMVTSCGEAVVNFIKLVAYGMLR